MMYIYIERENYRYIGSRSVPQMIYQVKNWKTWHDELGRSPSQVASDHQDYYNINKNLKMKVAKFWYSIGPEYIYGCFQK